MSNIKFIPGEPAFLFNCNQKDYEDFISDKNLTPEQFYNKYCFAIANVECSGGPKLNKEDGIRMLSEMQESKQPMYNTHRTVEFM